MRDYESQFVKSGKARAINQFFESENSIVLFDNRKTVKNIHGKLLLLNNQEKDLKYIEQY